MRKLAPGDDDAAAAGWLLAGERERELAGWGVAMGTRTRGTLFSAGLQSPGRPRRLSTSRARLDRVYIYISIAPCCSLCQQTKFTGPPVASAYSASKSRENEYIERAMRSVYIHRLEDERLRIGIEDLLESSYWWTERSMVFLRGTELLIDS